jgi:predicted DNA binding CopG/RHH family protein
MDVASLEFDKADLTTFDLSDARASLRVRTKDPAVNMRLPKALLDAVKAHAAKQRIPYQRFIRAVLEKAVRREPRKGGKAA